MSPAPQELDTKPSGIEERQGRMPATTAGRRMRQDRGFDDRYVAKGTTVENKRELLKVLRDWLNASGAPTIGPVGN